MLYPKRSSCDYWRVLCRQELTTPEAVAECVLAIKAYKSSKAGKDTLYMKTFSNFMKEWRVWIPKASQNHVASVGAFKMIEDNPVQPNSAQLAAAYAPAIIASLGGVAKPIEAPKASEAPLKPLPFSPKEYAWLKTVCQTIEEWENALKLKLDGLLSIPEDFNLTAID